MAQCNSITYTPPWMLSQQKYQETGYQRCNLQNIYDAYLTKNEHWYTYLDRNDMISDDRSDIQGLYSLSRKTSYPKISWSLEGARSGRFETSRVLRIRHLTAYEIEDSALPPRMLKYIVHTINISPPNCVSIHWRDQNIYLLTILQHQRECLNLDQLFHDV